jgi:hypothetical protein
MSVGAISIACGGFLFLLLRFLYLMALVFVNFVISNLKVISAAEKQGPAKAGFTIQPRFDWATSNLLNRNLVAIR